MYLHSSPLYELSECTVENRYTCLAFWGLTPTSAVTWVSCCCLMGFSFVCVRWALLSVCVWKKCVCTMKWPVTFISFVISTLLWVFRLHRLNSLRHRKSLTSARRSTRRYEMTWTSNWNYWMKIGWERESVWYCDWKMNGRTKAEDTLLVLVPEEIVFPFCSEFLCLY